MKKIKYFIPIIIYAILIFLISAIEVPRINYRLFKKIEMYAHFFEYFIFSTLLFYAISKSFPLFSRIKSFLLVLLVTCVISIADELFQSLFKYRRSQLSDFFADVTGCICALISIGIVLYIDKKIKVGKNELNN